MDPAWKLADYIHESTDKGQEMDFQEKILFRFPDLHSYTKN